MTTWTCAVCGYQHEGDAPPETCPVCGVGADSFTADDGCSAPEQTAAPVVTSWICAVCGYQHEGDAPPEVCPVCGVGADAFKREGGDADSAAASSDFAGHLVIIGAGIAGVAAAEAARRQAPDCRISLINGEDDAPYQRINLTRYLAGAVDQPALALHPAAWYAEQRVEQIQTRIRRIDRSAGQLETSKDERIDFDRLIVATGALPYFLPLDGIDRPGVQCLRRLDEAQALLEQTTEDSRVVIIGGGVLGLECAGALAGRGRAVTVLERSAWLMTRQLDQGGGQRLGAYLDGLGISVVYQVATTGISQGNDSLLVELDNGDTLPADRVVLCIGVSSDTGLGRDAGLEIEHGILVDDLLRTNDERIYAAGDCCQHRGRCYGLWTVAQFQGNIAGGNAVGNETSFLGLQPSVQLKVLDLPVIGIGHVQATDGVQDLCEQDEQRYRRLFFRGRTLIGAVFVGDNQGVGLLADAIDAGCELDAIESIDSVLQELG